MLKGCYKVVASSRLGLVAQVIENEPLTSVETLNKQHGGNPCLESFKPHQNTSPASVLPCTFQTRENSELLSSWPLSNGVDQEAGPREFGVKLSLEDIKSYNKCIQAPSDKVMTRVGSVSFDSKLLSCLGNGAWLNDEVINGYMRLLQERDTHFRKSKAGKF